MFIGSCTNSRIEDLRAAAAVLRGRHKAANVKWAIVVPGSGLVKRMAEAEGLDKVFIDAGLEWREPGCSACLGMNPDKVPPGERCASTSNRNFVGRQGPGARTHLVSPAMAAAAAVTGRLTDVRELAGDRRYIPLTYPISADVPPPMNAHANDLAKTARQRVQIEPQPRRFGFRKNSHFLKDVKEVYVNPAGQGGCSSFPLARCWDDF